MELNPEFANIVHDFQIGLNVQHYMEKLNWISGDEAPSRTSVYRWFGEFNLVRNSLQDEGCTKSVPNIIDAVR